MLLAMFSNTVFKQCVNKIVTSVFDIAVEA